MQNHLTLTGGWKMMNMAKLGIVSALGNYFHSTTKPNNGGACSLLPYTLCEQKTKPTRYSWRYGFAVYISSINGCALPAFATPSGRSAAVRQKIFNWSGVTRSQSVSNRDCKTKPQNPAKPYGLRLPSLSPPEKELFRLFGKLFHLLETRAPIGLRLVLRVFCREAAMSNSGSQAQGFVFDFGTSPHGLAVELARMRQETRKAEDCLSLEDGFGIAATGRHAERSEHGGQAAGMRGIQ